MSCSRNDAAFWVSFCAVLMQSLRRHQFGARQRGFKHSEQPLLLAYNRLLGVEPLLLRQPGPRLGQATKPFPADKFDQINLDFVAVSHVIILQEIRKIATCDLGSPAKPRPILRAPLEL